MKLGYELKVEQSQRLVMTPELIQAINILQCNTQELEEFVQEELLANPMLEKIGVDKNERQETLEAEAGKSENSQSSEEKNIENLENDSVNMSNEELAEAILEGRYDDISYRQKDYSKADSDFSFEQFIVPAETLKEHLMEQLSLVSLGSTSCNIASYIIESLDDNGYMTLTIEELMHYFGKTEERIKNLVRLIQSFEPAGVAAKDLKQCLKLQLKRKGLLTKNVNAIIKNYLQDLAENRIVHIAKELGISAAEVQEISDLLRTLEPKPGREFASETVIRYIVPDIILEKEAGAFVLRSNDDSVPKLIVSPYYDKVRRQSGGDEEVSKFLNDKLNSAVWLIKSIEQRKNTIQKVAKAVVEKQKEFFEKGVKYLKPLTLRDVADDIGIHESTVSRAVNEKYIQSPMGVFEIKYFFSSGVHSDNADGAIAAESVKSIIRDIIAKENPRMPYSDQCLCELLKEQSIEISRRTVAKYRDEMNILSSSKRKRF